MISKKIQKSLNDQLNYEMFSAYVYMAMQAHLDSIGLQGMANWLKIQTHEEMIHAMMIFNYLNEAGGRVILKTIDAPPEKWDTPLAAFEHAYEHECGVTKRIHKIVDQAQAESDHATNNFLQWFVAEQVEEEASVDQIIQRLKLVADTPGGLFLIDQELAQRIFTMPSNFTL
ncbi:ferritin [Candidatus Sumerlaeota bacterium]